MADIFMHRTANLGKLEKHQFPRSWFDRLISTIGRSSNITSTIPQLPSQSSSVGHQGLANPLRDTISFINFFKPLKIHQLSSSQRNLKRNASFIFMVISTLIPISVNSSTREFTS